MDWRSLRLEAISAQIWQGLEAAINNPASAFRTPVLCTHGENSAAGRVVVLRKVNQPQRLLVCYSDFRASKVRQIETAKEVQWVFFDQLQSVQIICAGEARCHHDDPVCAVAWESSVQSHRQHYCSPFAPGTPVKQPDLARLNAGQTASNDQAGYENFAVIESVIESIDWLLLDPAGNRRARFNWNGTAFASCWLAS
jgi:pyridoxamine 5'-phosphate oxidase